MFQPVMAKSENSRNSFPDACNTLQDQLDEFTANTRDMPCFCRELHSVGAQWKQVGRSNHREQGSGAKTGRAATDADSPFLRITRKLIPPYPPCTPLGYMARLSSHELHRIFRLVSVSAMTPNAA